MTGDYSDATSQNWVSAFDAVTGALTIAYSQVDYDADYPTPQIVSFNLRVTLTNPRSVDALNTLVDDFTITFSDNCSTDTLTLGSNNLGELVHIIGDSTALNPTVDFT